MCPMPYTRKMRKQILDYHNMVRRTAEPAASDMEKMVSVQFLTSLVIFFFGIIRYKTTPKNKYYLVGIRKTHFNLYLVGTLTGIFLAMG